MYSHTRDYGFTEGIQYSLYGLSSSSHVIAISSSRQTNFERKHNELNSHELDDVPSFTPHTEYRESLYDTTFAAAIG